MQVSISRKYDMLTRIDTFRAKHQDRFAAGTLGAELFDEVSASVNQINEQEVARRLARTSSADSRSEARRLLRQDLVRIRNTARAIAVEEPLLVTFELPQQPSDRVLLDLARTFARDAAPVAARFIAHRLPDTFLADLQERTEAFAAIVQRRTAGRSSGHEATERLKAAVAKGVAAARRLDAIVANEFRDEPELVAAWTLDRVIGPSRRQPRAATSPIPAQPPAPVATGTTTTGAPAVVAVKDTDQAA